MQIAIFARAPVAGAAKTRLIPRLGAAGAARAHRSMVLCAIDNASARPSAQSRCGLRVMPTIDFFVRCGAADTSPACTPAGDDLWRAHGTLPRESSAGGTGAADGQRLPGARPPELQACARSLEAGDDAVLIPAEDGGYVLVGAARELPPDIFRGIPGARIRSWRRPANVSPHTTCAGRNPRCCGM